MEVSNVLDVSKKTADITVTSDASGSWGCDVFWKSKWFHFSWHSSLHGLSITIKQLFPVVVAAAIFGHEWRGLLVEFKVDNMTVLHVINNTYSKDQHFLHLICTVSSLSF